MSLKTLGLKLILLNAKQQLRHILALTMSSSALQTDGGYSEPTLRDRFQGCLIGGIAGDCLGAPFEALTMGCIKRKRIEEIIGVNSKKLSMKKDGYYQFTDDSAMARCICQSLIEKNGVVASDLASKFLNEFTNNKNRGYGAGMFVIFYEWQNHGTSLNPLHPAKEQFSGSGSYGNGAAMRVAPVALFAGSEKDLIKLSKETALLTHANKYGHNGAILQALAVYKALQCSGKLDKKQYISELITAMSDVEGVDKNSIKIPGLDGPEMSKNQSDMRFSRRSDFTFTSQLMYIDSLLSAPNPNIDQTTIIKHIGNDISAQEAVVAAVWSFVNNCDKNFVETLLYAVSLGGDTDTIATMACAIAGAYFGASAIPPNWSRVCEGVDDAREYADQLYERLHSE